MPARRSKPSPRSKHSASAEVQKLTPPLEPMLAKIAAELPPAGEVLYEPKWDGFRAIVFRDGDDVYIQSRDQRPFDRYFPDLHSVFLRQLPRGCVVDGEIVIATDRGLDFDALQMRLHPAESRVAKLAAATPASFVAFDLLARNGRNLMNLPQSERRTLLETVFGTLDPPLFLTPMTRDRKLALDWLKRFEGAGLDGVIAKDLALPYQPGRRAMIKVKHVRTADCVVAGFRWYKDSRDAVGSLLLGLYDEHGVLHHVGVASSFSLAARKALAVEFKPLQGDAMKKHPWRDWARAGDTGSQRMPGAQSRWSAGKDLAWEPLRIERACEVKYDHLQGDRFRHAAIFLRWRPDKPPQDCRYDQLETVAPFEVSKVLRTRASNGGSAKRKRM